MTASVKPVISVIVPVYNIDTFLPGCMESLLAQTFSQFEILCIDDASSDGSVEIVNRYQRQDCRVKLIQQAHAGVSAARNLGIRYARGEYIVFVDGNDWVEKDMLEKMLQRAEETGCDIVACSARVHFAQGGNTRRDRSLIRGLTVEEGLWDAENASENVWTVVGRSGVWPFIWNKLIRTDLIRNNQIAFSTELALGEDGVFLQLLFQYTRKVAFVSDWLYNYRYMRKDSATINHFQDTVKRFDHHMQVVRVMFCEFDGRELMNQNRTELLKWSIFFLYPDFVRLPTEKQAEAVPALQTLFWTHSAAAFSNQLDRITKKRLGHMMCASRKFTKYSRLWNILRYKIDNRIVRLLNIH